MSNYPKLPYSRYPVYPELRCGTCKVYDQTPQIQQQKGIAYKNGVPYNCNCDLISAPYSMPYDALNCKQCQPPYHGICNAQNKASCECNRRATFK